MHSARWTCLAALALATAAAAAASSDAIWTEDFADCENGQPSSSEWTMPYTQWGGTDVNGGVAPANTACVTDAALGKQVLALTAHGDLYNGTGPKGVLKDGTPRPANQEFRGWTYGTYNRAHPCDGYCDVRRVGAAIQSKQTFKGGHVQLHMKPCKEFGVVSSLWLFQYKEHYCTAGPAEPCPVDYQKQCCGGAPCTQANDVCEGTWIENLEIDIELPTSDTDVQPRAIDPNFITFINGRFSTYTALPSGPHIPCGSTTPCSAQDYVWLGNPQNDGKYHMYDIYWDPVNYNVTFAVDGVVKATVLGANKVPTEGQMWLGAWIPNSWAGSPDFDTCVMNVDYVRVGPL